MSLSVVCLAMHRRGKEGRIMVLVFTIGLLGISIQTVGAIKELIVEKPFYLRARIHDSQTASVLFEIARENTQRTCQMYKFTIRRNHEQPYSMPEQNLTFWRNSLELTHLPMGDYRICAVICSEYLKHPRLAYQLLNKRNRSIPISACVTIHAYRSHFLILTLYILVVLILTFSQIIFTLRKRKTRAHIKTALIDVENTLQKWRTAQTTTTSDPLHTYSILQSLVTLPAAPIDYSVTSPGHPSAEEHRPSHPVIFHLEIPSEQSTSEIP